MKNTVMRRLVLGALGLAVIAGSSPAFARSAETDGARASTRSSEGYKFIRVFDTKDDGRTVYGEYHRQASPSTTRTLHNKSGPNTEAMSGTGSKILDQKACVSLVGPDRCSGTVANP